MQAGKITDNFWYKEFIVSAGHPELLSGIFLSNCDHAKLFYLCKTFLEPIRSACGNKPVRTLSGKRDLVLNSAVDGVVDSDHFYQEERIAVDFDFFGYHYLLWEAYKLVPEFGQSGFGQAILYLSSKDLSNPLFLHLSLVSRKHTAERLLTIDGIYYNIDSASEKYPVIGHLLSQGMESVDIP